jgi:hypothetical protein
MNGVLLAMRLVVETTATTNKVLQQHCEPTWTSLTRHRSMLVVKTLGSVVCLFVGVAEAC